MKIAYIALLVGMHLALVPNAWAAKKKKTESTQTPAAQVATPAESPPTESSSTRRKRWYGYAQASSFILFQGSGGNTFSGIVSWNPTYFFTPHWAVRGNLGISVLKGTGRFVATEYQVLGAYAGFNPLLFEVGAGAQTWFGNGGTHFLLSGNGAWMLKHPVLHVIDRAFLGYSAYFFTSDLTHQIKLGIGASF